MPQGGLITIEQNEILKGFGIKVVESEIRIDYIECLFEVDVAGGRTKKVI